MTKFVAVETLLVRVQFDSEGNMHRDIFNWHVENDIFPLRGTSGGSPECHYGTYRLEDGRKMLEWLKTKGTQVETLQ